MSRGMTSMQEHALSVIRARGGEVFILDGKARTGWDVCSFSPQTVRALAGKGRLVRTGDSPETYRVAEPAEGVR